MTEQSRSPAVRPRLQSAMRAVMGALRAQGPDEKFKQHSRDNMMRRQGEPSHRCLLKVSDLSAHAARAPRWNYVGCAACAITRRWRALLVGFAVPCLTACPSDARKDALSRAEPYRHAVVLKGSDHRSVSYLQSGDTAGPVIILVHGTPGDASEWIDYVSKPPPGVMIIALDRLGYGRSVTDTPVISLHQQAAAVAALLPTDGRRVVLLGHSLGGAVVAKVAAEHPDRISAVVLLAAALDPAQEKTLLIQRLGAWRPVRFLLPRWASTANAELMALKSELIELQGELPLITAKIVIVHGTKDDLVPPDNVPYMQSRLTGARCVKTVMLPGHNHFLPWNSVSDVREALQEALAPQC